MNYRLLRGCAYISMAAVAAAPAFAGTADPVAPVSEASAEAAAVQDGGGTAAQPAHDGEAGEIVVTATKQSSSLARTPAAITAISADQIAPGGIQNIGDLQTVVPNVSIGDQFGVNRTFVRGIGLTSIDQCRGQTCG